VLRTPLVLCPCSIWWLVQDGRWYKTTTNRDAFAVAQPHQKHLSITVTPVVRWASILLLVLLYSSGYRRVRYFLMVTVALYPKIVNVSECHALCKHYQRTQKDCLGFQHCQAHSEILSTPAAAILCYRFGAFHSRHEVEAVSAGEMFEAAVVIIFDSHLIYRHERLESPEMFRGNIYHFRDSLILKFCSRLFLLSK
jgi:hypothetical protein